ncbi:MAG TPA: zinc-binding dehydrogenase [Kofleriaceae bacterium]|nr:zinc-binding dehydrogenase [Kofleriaceae bacterium]
MRVMKAVVLRRHGDPDVLESAELPVPEPGPGQVRVAVRAVAVNHLDLWVRRGGPAFHLEYPHRLGSDIAGVVHALGAGVDDLEVGSRAVVNPGLSCGVCRECLLGRDNLCPRYGILGETRSGGYGQFIVVPRQNIAPFPGDLSFPDAASSLLTFLTAWQMLVGKARVRPGETVLVQGAGSGVGVAAVQIARLHGARVIATAGTDAKLERLRELGADEVINYQKADFVAEVKGLTDRRGADVVIEHVGGDTFTASIRATATGGRLVTCGATAGPKPEIDLRHVFFRQIAILGSTMGSKGDLLEVLVHLAAGRLRPVVDRVLPLAEAAEAHRVLEARAAFGKIVLEP